MRSGDGCPANAEPSLLAAGASSRTRRARTASLCVWSIARGIAALSASALRRCLELGVQRAHHEEASSYACHEGLSLATR